MRTASDDPGGGGRQLLSIVDRIFILNLPDRTDRRREMDVQLHSIGLSLDHRAVELFPAIRPTEKGGFPTIGTRGCFLSHLAVLERIAASNCKAALILEDDVDFRLDFNARMPRIAAALREQPWDIFYSVSDREGVVGSDPNALFQLPRDESVLTTHFIAFSKDAAASASPYLRRMLDRPPGDPDGGPMHVDGAYGWFRAAHPQFRTVCTAAALAVQRPSRTDIHELKWFDKIPLIRTLANWVRLARHKRQMHD